MSSSCFLGLLEGKRCDGDDCCVEELVGVGAKGNDEDDVGCGRAKGARGFDPGVVCTVYRGPYVTTTHFLFFFLSFFFEIRILSGDGSYAVRIPLLVVWNFHQSCSKLKSRKVEQKRELLLQTRRTDSSNQLDSFRTTPPYWNEYHGARQIRTTFEHSRPVR